MRPFELLFDNPSVDDKGYRIFADGQLFVVRWHNTTIAGARALDVDLRAHHATVQRPLVFVFLIGKESPMPDRQTREALQHGQQETAELTLTMRSVILPGTLRQQLIRKILVGMRMAGALRGQPFHIDANLTALAEVVEKAIGRPAAETLAAMVESGIISADEIELDA